MPPAGAKGHVGGERNCTAASEPDRHDSERDERGEPENRQQGFDDALQGRVEQSVARDVGDFVAGMV